MGAELVQATGSMDDVSWNPGMGWDVDLPLEHHELLKHGMLSKPTNADPVPMQNYLHSTAEQQYVASKVAAAKAKLLGPGVDCSKAHAANQYACDAYGEHSPVCTGSQTQYVLSCGSSAPRPLFHKMGKGPRAKKE